MNKEVNESVLSVLSGLDEPVERRQLHILCGAPETEEFNNALSYLEQKGKIIINRKKVGLPSTMGYLAARIVRQARGYSFAEPIDGSTEDLFVRAASSKGAMPGDLVMLKNIEAGEKGLSAQVDKILEKGTRIITGTIEKPESKFGRSYIIPDSFFANHLRIVQGGELKSKAGDKVKATIYYDQKEKRVYARVIKVYGRGNSAKICADAIIDSYGIPVKFPVPVKHEAAKKAAEPITEEEVSRRLDLTDEPILTIDGADAKDLDDAISVKKLENGWELGVHIADVSHYVTSGSRLDEEARQRGTSVYFADRVIPMLPVEISNGCCSLNAGTKKLTFSAILRLNDKADLIDYRFEKSVIVSKVRGVYSEVNALFDDTADDALKEKYAPVSETLSEGRILADLLKEKAKKRGGMEIDTTELRFVLDENGVCTGVAERERGEAEELIEQFMILANSAAALYAKSVGMPFVYRVHEAPDEEKLASLSELAAACGFQTRRIKEGVRQTDLAALIEKAKETRYSKLISTQVLRSMAKARYDSRPLGHFGLSLDDYCHFTSPIRRYPDTSIHRILTDLVSGVPLDTIKRKYSDFAVESAKLSSEFELRAVKAERDAEKCYAAEYMRAHLGERYHAVVSGVTNKGIFVMIPEGIEGFIDLMNIPGSDFIFDGMTTTTDRLTGKSFTIGDEVYAEASSAEVALGKIDFILASEE